MCETSPLCPGSQGRLEFGVQTFTLTIPKQHLGPKKNWFGRFHLSPKTGCGTAGYRQDSVGPAGLLRLSVTTCLSHFGLAGCHFSNETHWLDMFKVSFLRIPPYSTMGFITMKNHHLGKTIRHFFQAVATCK